MNKMTQDNCTIGDQKVMTNTKGALMYHYTVKNRDACLKNTF